MQNREPRAKATNASRILTATLAFVSLSFPGMAQAADYCYRHITNNRDVAVTLRMCNTSGDCSSYPVAPRSSVQYAIPDDNSVAILVIDGGSFRATSGYRSSQISIFHHRNTGRDALERIAQSGDWCRISRLGEPDEKIDIWSNARPLGAARFREAITVNEPANGDIIVHGEDNGSGLLPVVPDVDVHPTLWVNFDVATNRTGPGFVTRPIPMLRNDFPDLWREGATAAVNGGRGFIYFFRDGWVARYNIASRYVSAGYPIRVRERFWPGLSALGPIDAAVNAGNGKYYFFGGGNYLRFDIASNRTDPGYPRAVTEGTWPGLPALGRVEAATNMGNGKIMFFSGNRMLRYDIIADRADPGYPQPIDHQTLSGATPPNGYRLSMAVAFGPGALIFFYSR